MATLLNVYELRPVTSQRSFYGKATVYTYDDGSAVLQSYNTRVMRRNPDGSYTRLWYGWSATTGRHIHAFSSMRKAEWGRLPIEA